MEHEALTTTVNLKIHDLKMQKERRREGKEGRMEVVVLRTVSMNYFKSVLFILKNKQKMCDPAVLYPGKPPKER